MTGALKLALFGLHRGSSADPDTLVRRARRAEEIGLESFWVGDHVALPAGSGDNPAEQPRLEAVVALAYMAAVTRRVRLAIGVIVLPQRQPVLLAKQLSTIDHLSKGRLIVGIGVGYLEPELRALGASLADRGARTDEYLTAMRALWNQPTPSFAGRFVSFEGVIERPRPASWESSGRSGVASSVRPGSASSRSPSRRAAFPTPTRRATTRRSACIVWRSSRPRWTALPSTS